jgi:hypothetical protein
VVIRGSIIGNATNPAVIAARGQAAPTATSDVAIGSLAVSGRVEYARVLAGYLDDVAWNADAQIGPVAVRGDWVASSIAAGARPGDNNYFGDVDDMKASGLYVKDTPGITSRIASLTINGQVVGTFTPVDHYGIVAENVVAVTVGGTPLPLRPDSKDFLAVGIDGDFKVREV